MTATAIIVPVPKAEPAIARWRRRYTEDRADAMPPHVTLLYPFVDDSVLVAGQIRQVRGILADFQPFEFVLADFGEFAASGTTAPVLYLAPDPPDRFWAMTNALVSVFPNYLPYGGQFTGVIPHLTVAEYHQTPLADIRDDVAPALPIRARAVEAHVMRYGDDGWRTKSRIYLGRKETTAP
jgi:2'-5' RNA ligase